LLRELDAVETPIGAMLDIHTIYYEPDVSYYPRGQQILRRFAGAELIEVPSHWQIPGLHGNEGNVEDWIKIKRSSLVLGAKKSITTEPNSRSSNFTAPSIANGCAMACSYCVAAGTLIATPCGTVPVEQIQDSDEVLSYTPDCLFPARVAGVAERQVDELLEIQVGERNLRATAEHPILTRRGWVEAGQLTHDDWAVAERCGIIGAQKITAIRPLQLQTTVHNFHVPGPQSYVANGIVTHNCYVPRRKGFANPITTFVNIEQITTHLKRHIAKQGPKPTPDQADPSLWVYEIGTNSDCSVDALVSDNVRDLVTLFREQHTAKVTFATKFVNPDLLNYDPQGKTRIRFSVMPQRIAKVVDIRTSKIADRVGAINDFVRAGYEVHVNFAPVIYYEGWQADYAELMTLIDDTLTPPAKAQLKTEVIFLTHNERMHEVNLGWHPKGEDLLWTPDNQETKYSQTGGENIRYRHGFKGRLVDELCAMIGAYLPYCEIRYAF